MLDFNPNRKKIRNTRKEDIWARHFIWGSFPSIWCIQSWMHSNNRVDILLICPNLLKSSFHAKDFPLYWGIIGTRLNIHLLRNSLNACFLQIMSVSNNLFNDYTVRFHVNIHSFVDTFPNLWLTHSLMSSFREGFVSVSCCSIFEFESHEESIRNKLSLLMLLSRSKTFSSSFYIFYCHFYGNFHVRLLLLLNLIVLIISSCCFP